jgi:4-alpha-glucanotransferase
MEGYRDPFNRRPYPWGREDTVLLAHYRRLSEIRRSNAVFADGETALLCAENGVFAFERRNGTDTICVCVNRSSQVYTISGNWHDLLSDTVYNGIVRMAPDTAVILKQR